jgi:glycosyltransferase involved in cell wall biosynthesis
VIECSVVVPTCRRLELLARCLAALVRQDLAPGAYEIIVADDGASEATRAHVARVRDRGHRVRYLPVVGSRHGPAAARNVGWRAAEGWLIAFTDDDTVPDPDWLRTALARFSRARHADEAQVDAAFGRMVVPLPERPSDYERDAAALEQAGFVTANCFVRRDVLQSLHGFDEAFTSAWREDSDLYFRLLAARHHVVPLDDAVVLHPVRPAPWGISIAQQRKSSFDALLYRKHPDLFAVYVRPARPSLYYVIAVALVVVVGGAVASSAWIALVGLAAWLALTLSFAVQRLRGTSRAPAHVAEMLVTSAVIPPVALFWRARGALRHRVLFW